MYCDAHGRLFSAKTAQNFFDAIRDVIENYIENRRIIDELNHYKEKREILGKHPIFSWMRRSGEIRGMKIGDLVRLNERLKNNIIKTRQKIRNEKKHPQTASRVERLKELEMELAEVNRLLNL